MNNRYVVLGGDHINPIGQIRSLGEVCIRPIVIACTDSPYMINKCKYIDRYHEVKSYKEGVDLLIDRYSGGLHHGRKTVVLNGDDGWESELDVRYDQLKDDFIFFNAGKAGRINHFMNKDVICDLAEQCGLQAPKREKVHLGDMPKTLKYPILTKSNKSIDGGWKEDVYICNNEEELKNAYKKITSPVLLLQEYVEKKNELALSGFSVNRGRDVYIPYNLSFFRLSSTSYGHYMYLTPYNNVELKSKIEKLLTNIGYEGCFEIEFLIDPNDNLLFLEVNFRFSAWNYIFTFGGVNMPLMWAESMEKGYVDLSSQKALFNYFTAMAEPGYFANVVRREITLKQYLRDLWNVDCRLYYNKYDPAPFWGHFFHKIKKKMW